MGFELPDGWKKAVLSDLVSVQRGFDLPSAIRQPGSVPVVGSAGISGTHSEARVTAPGITIGRSGASIGVVTFCERDFWPLNTALFVTDFRGNDPRFAHYLLRTLPLAQFNSGSAQPSLNRNFIKAIPVILPKPREQGHIAETLGVLDDKIDSNRRLADRLEAATAAVFRARFVDFLGVEEFEQSEIDSVPRGWKVLRFSEAVKVNPQVQLRKGVVAPYIEMAAIPRWALRPTRIAERSYSGGSRFEPGDTLMARITGCIEHGKGAFVDFVDGPASGSTEFLVLRAKPPLTPEAVFLLSRDERVRSHAITNMTGSSGRQRVPVTAFDDLEIAVPPDLEAWGDDAEFLRAAFARTRALWNESQTLEGIRDSLLPKLISGEIRVPDTADPNEAVGALTDVAAA